MSQKNYLCKVKLLCFFLFLTCFFFSCSLASTNTFERTEENLQINPRITVTEKVKKAALATPKVDATEKVYDFAQLLTEEEEESLYQGIIEFSNTYNMDMVIVTIDKNNKSSSQDYADDFYDYNDFGIGDNCDGLLFLIDMDKRMMWISTAGKAILIYDDNRIDSILDDTYNEISNQRYADCSTTFINSAKKYAKKGLPQSNQNYEINEKGEYVKKKAPFPLGVILILSFIASGVFVGMATSKHKLAKIAVQANDYLVPSSLKLTTQTDQFLYRHISETYIPPSSSSSSGGGGSSTHSSSSGCSHGGGGRSF